MAREVAIEHRRRVDRQQQARARKMPPNRELRRLANAMAGLAFKLGLDDAQLSDVVALVAQHGCRAIGEALLCVMQRALRRCGATAR